MESNRSKSRVAPTLRKQVHAQDSLITHCTDCKQGIFNYHKYHWVKGKGLVHVDCENKMGTQMKLKLLRTHYYSSDNRNWIPKKAFKSPEHVKQETGFAPELCNLYECDFCKHLHIATYPNKNIKKRTRHKNGS